MWTIALNSPSTGIDDLHRDAAPLTLPGPQANTDLLRGAAAIAAYLLGDARLRRVIYHYAEPENQVIPVWRLGRRLYASKRTIDRWKASQETQALARLRSQFDMIIGA